MRTQFRRQRDIARTLRRRQRGVTIVEYVVAGGVISAIVLTSFTQLGEAVSGLIDTLVQVFQP